MHVAMRVVGDWSAPGEEISQQHVLGVTLSAVGVFTDAIDEPATLPILLEPTLSISDSPLAASEPSSEGERRIFLPARGPYWARLAFQFAHEFCHHLADQRKAADPRFGWLEESLCEAGSLYALRAMSRAWANGDPPFDYMVGDAPGLFDYAAERISRPDHNVPPGTSFQDWLENELDSLTGHGGQREKNVIVAKELLSVFEDEPRHWRAMTTFRSHPGAEAPDLRDFLAGWATVGDSFAREAVEQISARLGRPA